MPAGEGRLSSEAIGEVEKEDGVLVLKRIHVSYQLNVERALLVQKRDAIERAHALHPDRCPVARSIKGSIAVTTSLNIEAQG